MKILICGLPGSGKSTLAESFSKRIGAVWLNADRIREHYNDWDFSEQGRIRQAQRMRYLADGVVLAGQTAVADFVCPTEAARAEFDADYTVWMDTIDKSRYEDTNAVFEKPLHYDYHVAQWFTDTDSTLADAVQRYKGQQNV